MIKKCQNRHSPAAPFITGLIEAIDIRNTSPKPLLSMD